MTRNKPHEKLELRPCTHSRTHKQKLSLRTFGINKVPERYLPVLYLLFFLMTVFNYCPAINPNP